MQQGRRVLGWKTDNACCCLRKCTGQLAHSWWAMGFIGRCELAVQYYQVVWGSDTVSSVSNLIASCRVRVGAIQTGPAQCVSFGRCPSAIQFSAGFYCSGVRVRPKSGFSRSLRAEASNIRSDIGWSAVLSWRSLVFLPFIYRDASIWRQLDFAWLLESPYWRHGRAYCCLCTASWRQVGTEIETLH